MGCGLNKQYKIQEKDLNELVNSIKSKDIQESGRILSEWAKIQSQILYNEQIKKIRSSINEVWKKNDERSEKERSKIKKEEKFKESIQKNMVELKKYAVLLINLEEELEKEQKKIKQQQKKYMQNISALRKISGNKIQKGMQIEKEKRIESKFEKQKMYIRESIIDSLNQTQLWEKYQLLETQFRYIQQEYDRLHTNLKHQQQKFQSLQKSKQKQLQQKHMQIRNLQEKLKNALEAFDEKDNKQKQLNLKIASLQEQLSQSKRKANTNNKVFSFLEKQEQNYYSYQNQCQKHQRASSGLDTAFGKFIKSSIVFPSQLVGKNIKHSIINILEPYATIKKTNLIFSFDLERPNNMYHYVKDTSKNLLFLGQLSNGYIVGAFSSQSFKISSEKLNSHPHIIFLFSINRSYKSVILNLKNQQQASQSVRLDKYFLRFGNNEMRITCNTKEGVCRLDPHGALFVRLGDQQITCMQFIGQQKDDFQLKKYEIFELQLDYKAN